MVREDAVQADFIGIKPVPTRSAFQMIFEIPIEEADLAMAALGGMPIPGTNRPCVIVRQKE